MEVISYTSNMADVEKLMSYSMVQAFAAEAGLAAHRSIACFLMLERSLLLVTGDFNRTLKLFRPLAGSLLVDRSDLTCVKDRFPLDELYKVEKPTTENKDASDSENDDEDDDDVTGEQDDEDDAGDEDFSGEEGDDDDEEGDPEEAPVTNGNGGSDDDEEDDDDDEEGEEDEDGEDEEEDEDEDQPPAKKRK